MKFCLATVATQEFVPGALVLFHSFLKNNPWFNGDLIVIHDDLTDEHRQQFSKFGTAVKFLRVSGLTQKLLAQLESKRPGLSGRMQRFFSIEIFALQGYDKILFCDSDLLFLSSVKEVFLQNDQLIACGDGPYHRGNSRDAMTYQELSQPRNNELRNTFNAGFLALGPDLISIANYEALQSMLSADIWESIKTDHTDQVLYNLLFRGMPAIIGPTYNYLMLHKDDQAMNRGLHYLDAKVLHFNGRNKPWMPSQLLQSSKIDDDFQHALTLWSNAYLSFLNSMEPQHQQ